ncbi:MAG: 3-hydroxyacyl-CoA dehydrogenase NAD-binding domain-containing protein [Acidobacteriota bacterium]
MAEAFRLDVGPDRLATLTFDLPGKSANIFTREAVAELERLVGDLGRRSDIGCLVLLSAKPRIFIAGADVDAIAHVTDPAEAEEASRRVHRIFAAWEALPFPTVAAIRGTCLGGGTELALASTYIVASDRADIRIGLPEIKLGILPGWGGCVRLPRRIGIAAALDIILAGKAIPSKTAFRLGLADALLPDGNFLHGVRNFAFEKIGQKGRRARKSSLQQILLEKNPLGRRVLFQTATKKTLAATKGQYPAPLRAIEVVRTGVSEGAEAGFAAEAKAIGELATSAISKNLVHVFQLMENAKKATGVPGAEPLPVESTAVLGAGVMGGGIAQIIADEAGAPVRLRDIAPPALASGMAHAASLFAKQVERRRLTKPAAATKMALLHPTLVLDGLQHVDLVIEAIVERLDIKQKTFVELENLTKPTAILASNTSSLSIDLIAKDTRDPSRVVGMHFFNPVHRMPLVEVIAGPRTSATAVNTVVAFSRKLGKTPIVVKDGPGFLVNRLLCFYMAEALNLLSTGHPIEELDRTMLDWGMPMGPIALVDEVGIDVAVKVAVILGDAFGDRLPPKSNEEKVVQSGRLGAKNQRGFYKYENRRRTEPDSEIYSVLGVMPRPGQTPPAKLVDRMVLPMVNEAARCLAEAIVRTPGDLDLSMILGTGFPPFRGGLCRYADERGLREIVGTLEQLALEMGPRFAPSQALRDAAQAGGFYRG